MWEEGRGYVIFLCNIARSPLVISRINKSQSGVGEWHLRVQKRLHEAVQREVGALDGR